MPYFLIIVYNVFRVLFDVRSIWGTQIGTMLASKIDQRPSQTPRKTSLGARPRRDSIADRFLKNSGWIVDRFGMHVKWICLRFWYKVWLSCSMDVWLISYSIAFLIFVFSTCFDCFPGPSQTQTPQPKRGGGNTGSAAHWIYKIVKLILTRLVCNVMASAEFRRMLLLVGSRNELLFVRVRYRLDSCTFINPARHLSEIWGKVPHPQI